MTFIKTVFVFMYFKVLELCKGIAFSMKYIGKNVLIPGFIAFLLFVALGAVSLGIWYFFHRSSAVGLIQHNSASGDYIYGVIVSCLGIGSAEFFAFILGVGLFFVVKENWHHVPELFIDNWVRAKRKVMGDKC
jgi:hypothetical protein